MILIKLPVHMASLPSDRYHTHHVHVVLKCYRRGSAPHNWRRAKDPDYDMCRECVAMSGFMPRKETSRQR